MYRPEQFVEDRKEVLLDAIRTIQLATLVTPHTEGIAVTHAPVVAHDGEDGVILEAHVARANPHWKHAGAGHKSVAIFQGPNAYVSPSSYPSKQEHGKVVPTWVYIAVHAHGVLETIDDADQLAQHLDQLTLANEQDRTVPWKVSDAPERYLETMKRGIVGLRFTVERLEGSWKINQHKSQPDRMGTAAGLMQSGPDGVALAEELRTRAPDT